MHDFIAVIYALKWVLLFGSILTVGALWVSSHGGKEQS